MGRNEPKKPSQHKIGDIVKVQLYVRHKWVNDNAADPRSYPRSYHQVEKDLVVYNRISESWEYECNPYGISNEGDWNSIRYRGYVTEAIPSTKRATKYNYCFEYDARILSADEIMLTDMTAGNSDRYCIQMQAKILKKAGYVGPLSGGTARGLSNAFAAIGMPDMVRRGWCEWEKVTKVKSAWGEERVCRQSRLTHCYQFKSPRPDIEIKDFVRIVKACKKNTSKFAKVVEKVINDPEAKAMLGTLDVLDVLKDIA